MKRLITTAAAMISAALLVASFAAPASAKPAKPDKPEQAKDLAAQQCAAAKKANKAAFDSLYGKHAMRNCIKAQTSTSQTELKNAAKECKAERRADPDAFTVTYGTGKNGRNALGKCVSQKVETAETTPSA